MGLFNSLGQLLGGEDKAPQDNWFDPLPAGGAQMAQAAPKRSFWDTVGQLSDVISMSRGAPGTYGIMEGQKRSRAKEIEEEQRRKATQNALGQWLVNPEDQAAFQRALVLDPDKALGIRKGLEGEDYTITEGQERRRGGKVIARGPEKLDTVEIDGVVFDKRTGKPMFESLYNRIIPGPNGSFNEQPRIGIGRGGIGGQQPLQAAPPQGEPASILRGAAESRVVAPEDAERVRASLGPNGQRAYDQWLQRNGIVVGKNIGGKTYYQINGRIYDNPEGR